MSDWEIWTRLAVASTGVICGLTLNELISFEIDWTALAIADGRARQAGMTPIMTVGLPGPGPSGVPWLVVLVKLAAIGICYPASLPCDPRVEPFTTNTVSYTHLRAHETRHDLVC